MVRQWWSWKGLVVEDGKVESASGHLKELSPKGCGTFMLGNFTEGYTTGIQGIS
jgi:hypothetical protein